MNSAVNLALRIIFEPEKDEVIRGLKKMHNKELRNLYPSSDVLGGSKQGRRHRRGMQKEWK
jgi:hypothetical protein